MINFILGLIIGGLIGVCVMCILQINRDNKLQKRINNAIKWIHNHIDIFEKRHIKIYDWNSLSNPKTLLKILGGDVDDE